MTHKRKLRGIAILITLAFLLSLLPAGMAGAASAYRAATVPNVDDANDQELGTLIAEIDGGIIDGTDDVVNFWLPSDFVIDRLSLEVPASLAGKDNELTTTTATYEINYASLREVVYGNLKITKLSDNEFQVQATRIARAGDASIFKVTFKQVDVKSGFSGDIKVVAEAPSVSGFPSGEVVIARVPGGKVELSVTNAPTFSDDTTADPIRIRVKEVTAGSLKEGSDTKNSLKLTLPDGFEWKGVAGVTQLWGETIDGYRTSKTNGVNNKKYILVGGIGTDELTVNLVTYSNAAGWSYIKTSKATAFELKLNIEVSDETEAKAGDVVAKVSGESDATPSEVTIAKYGEYGATIEAKDAPQVFAGMLEQEIGDIVIKESVKGSLIQGRTVLLTLPANAKWGKLDDGDEDNGAEIKFVGFPGDDGRTAKYEIKKQSTSDAAELTLEDLEVVLEPGVTGDLVIEVSGTAGLSGKLVVGKVVAPVTMTAADKPAVKIGVQAQSAGDITITEAAAGAIKEGNLILDLPDGVRFATVPKVEVVSGDLDIDGANVKRQNDDNELLIPIDDDSNVASTIKITGVQYTVDRNVAEGDIVVKLKGDAVIEVNDESEISDYWGSDYDDAGNRVRFATYGGGTDYYEVKDEGLFPASTTAAKVVNATVVTPAPGEVKGTAVLVIGSTTMKVNGVDVTMDVAPYLKNSRTYVPVRFCAKALGIDENNIIWDGATQTATIVAGAKVIQMKVGSKAMIINGATVNMDTAPELVPPGRVCLPIGWLAWALGAKTSWDNATQTATLEL